MSEQYVVIVDRSAFNESVGEMWQETKIFGANATLQEVVDWALSLGMYLGYSPKGVPTHRRITLTRAHPEAEETKGAGTG